ncbi:uncharacterized protein B0J16DRAFT_293293 [Fusarium flagelliforme]|uniref:uncharacterized protein n=1 Tax=Fusarium flagelliforme TaxID=2675880 RepID=UPI001E8D4AE1|nr:uncharacterized protein B0J16DRAFT_293293 [Fusarium flagelliforme]KAH7173254.1 hypothetical protein B0J16DRAFT_293293 [Fusarium flagelliforme]
MRPFAYILACLLALPLAVAGLSEEASEVLGKLPNCASKCLVDGILKSTCGLDDIKCSCTNVPLLAQLEKCVLADCTVPEALVTQNTTQTLCGAPITDNRTFFVRLNDIMGTISGIFCLIRFLTKFWFKVPLGMDDLFMLITILVAIPCVVINSYYLAPAGIGTDIWTLTPTQITDFGYWFYIIGMMYFVLQTPLKLTLVFFYLRIFPSTGMRRVLWGTVAFTVAYGFTFILVVVFQCRPINYFWLKWDGMHEGSCVSVNGIAWSSSAINIAMDFWILGLPLSQLKKMNLDWKKKVGIGMMFSVGVFVTIMSILRLYACIVAGLSHTNNYSQDYLAMSKWSTIELNVNIWCACMPTIRVLLVRVFPKVLGTSKKYLHYGSKKTGPQSGAKAGENSNGVHHSQGSNSSGSSPFGESTEYHIGKAGQSHVRVDPIGITCDRTYEVEYGMGDDDETYLVHMKTMDHGSKGTKSSPRSEDSV